MLPIIISVPGLCTDPSVQFIENKGQWDKAILYRAEIQNGYLFITEGGLEYVFYDGEKTATRHLGSGHEDEVKARLNDTENSNPGYIDMHAIGLEFIDPSEEIKINAAEELDVYYNYYLGNDPDKWAENVKAYREINYEEIYPGIDMRIYSEKGNLKYDIEVDSHADPEHIQFSYKGADDISQSNNSIYARTSLSTIIENSPFTYQIIDGDTMKIASRYKLKENTFGFEFPDDYDRSNTLIIDPLLVFSTYSGSSKDNWGNTATFDIKGNVYSGGTVRNDLGGIFPATRGSFQTEFGGIWDIGILKFDSTGSRLLYGTYLGGSGTETPFSIIVDNNNELLILGITGSSDFPTTENAYSRLFQGGDSVTNALGTYNDGGSGGVKYLQGSDLFIAKLDENGRQLLASTYIGGTENDGINNGFGLPLSRNYGDEFRGEINIDGDNNVYIAANTSSTDFPIINGFQPVYGGGTHDGVVAKLNPDLSSIIWSSYIGGTMADAAYGIKIIEDSVSYITGGTMSADFPVTPGAYDTQFGGDIDGYLASISYDGRTLTASTFLGTPEYDQSYFLDTDEDQNVYAFGQTRGSYPVTEGIYSNPLSGQFIHKLSPDLSESKFSTVVGSGSGIPDISPTAFLVNECGNIFLSGWGGWINSRAPKYNGGNTFDLPLTEDAFQRTTDGSDFYLMVLDAGAERLLYGTYLGAGNAGPEGGSGEHVDGGTSRFDKRGIVYHAICACADNSQFPTTPGVWSNTNNSNAGRCNNGVFKFDLSALRADFTTDSYEFDNPGVTTGCMPFEVVFLNKSFGGEEFEWDFGDGSDLSYQEDSLYHVYEESGIYTVTLKAFDENTCLKVDIAQKNIDVRKPNFLVPEDRTICQFDQTQLVAGGAVSFQWSPAEDLDNPEIRNPMASPDTTTMYYIQMVDGNECTLFDSVLVTVLPDISTDFIINKIYDCHSHPKVELLNISENSTTNEWSFGDGQTSAEDSIIHTYEKPGKYTVKLNASNEGQCQKSKEEEINIADVYVPNIITPNGDEKNDVFRVITDARVDLKIFNRWGKVLYKDTDYQDDWNGEDVPAGTYYYEIQLEDNASCKGWLQVLK